MANSGRNAAFSRRIFLMGALASVSVPSFFNSARGANGGPNDTILLGCIGVGRQGRADMQEAIQRGLDLNARVVALCDVDSARVKKAAELVKESYQKAGIENAADCQLYGDFRELLKRQDLDGVIIVTPDHWHALPAIMAAKAGKDIYLEKPMTYSVYEGQQLIKAVRENKRVLQVGSQQRSSIYFRKACELVRNGVIGNLQVIRVTLPSDKGTGDPTETPVPENLNYEMWMGPSQPVPYAEAGVHPQRGFGRPGWLQIEKYCRGMITGWGAHMNDIAQWGNNADETGLIEIEASGEFPKRGLFDVHTNYKAEGKYANGVKLIQETGSGTVQFEGDKGWINVHRDKLSASDTELLRTKLPADAVKLYESKNHMANFIECMRSRKDPVAPVEVGHRSNTVCLITHISMKLGRKLYWDPKAEKFKNDEEANALLNYKHREPWTI